ncbi:MAG: hypothetical protein GF334_01015 [Candidatus Altiarchaeales archaeon]|nr:hypothetical protein [Candidatus Altiarchaeales archaeon]
MNVISIVCAVIGCLLFIGVCLWSLELQDMYCYCKHCKITRPYGGEITGVRQGIPVREPVDVRCPTCLQTMTAMKRNKILLWGMVPFQLIGKGMHFFKEALIDIAKKLGGQS